MKKSEKEKIIYTLDVLNILIEEYDFIIKEKNITGEYLDGINMAKAPIEGLIKQFNNEIK